MRAAAAPIIVFMTAALLGGCSTAAKGVGTPSNTSTTVVGTASSSSLAPAPTISSPAPTAAPDTTDALIAKFRAAGLPIGTTLTYTAATDPNDLLGRPNGYTAKESWTDTRINPSDAKDSDSGSVDLGGSIEQYTDKSGANSRDTYIKAVEKANPIVGTEYDFVVGDFLIRVSQVLTPNQADAYGRAAAE